MQEAEETAERIWNVIRAFNVREGMRRTDDTLPKTVSQRADTRRPVQGHGRDREMLEKMKDEYYAVSGWDRADRHTDAGAAVRTLIFRILPKT